MPHRRVMAHPMLEERALAQLAMPRLRIAAEVEVDMLAEVEVADMLAAVVAATLVVAVVAAATGNRQLLNRAVQPIWQRARCLNK